MIRKIFSKISKKCKETKLYPMKDAPQDPNNVKTNYVFIKLEDLEGAVYTNQTRRFQRVPNWGTKILVITYIYDVNVILRLTIKSFGRRIVVSI